MKKICDNNMLLFYIAISVSYIILGCLYRVGDGIALSYQGMDVWNCIKNTGGLSQYYSYCLLLSDAF